MLNISVYHDINSVIDRSTVIVSIKHNLMKSYQVRLLKTQLPLNVLYLYLYACLKMKNS